MNTENLAQNYLWKVSNKQYNDNLSQLSSEEIANLHQKNYVQTVASLYQEEENSSYMNMLMCKELELYSSAVDGKSGMVTPAPNQMLSWKNSMSVGGIQQVMKIMNLSHSSKVVFTPQTDNNHCMLLQSPQISPYNGSEIISNNKGYENVKSLNLPNANCQDFNPKRPKRQRVNEVSEEMTSNLFEFRSAREQLEINETKKSGSPKTDKYGNINVTNKFGKKSLGSRPRNQCFSKFIPPTGKGKDDQSTMDDKEDAKSVNSSNCKIKGIEPQLVELILSEIMDHGPTIEWDDIAGLEYAKATIKEIVVWPLLRPDIFTGLRGPPKGILLFGPPGTGKTLIGKCIASQSGATFFSISASSLTSKWIGQGEKLVRALFVVAKLHQPSVIFIDEIDSLLSQRSDTEHESSRRIKTEFFVQLDGATTVNEDRILVVGATNRPQEIDEAARRRLVKRLYIPLPDDNARNQIITKLLSQQSHGLNEKEINIIVHGTEGYSGADVTNLCKDAALGPIRSLKVKDISNLHKDDVRQIEIIDFEMALTRVKPSVSPDDITSYIKWNKLFGCGSF